VFAWGWPRSRPGKGQDHNAQTDPLLTASGAVSQSDALYCHPLCDSVVEALESVHWLPGLITGVRTRHVDPGFVPLCALLFHPPSAARGGGCRTLVERPFFVAPHSTAAEASFAQLGRRPSDGFFFSFR
jgi:hypothetical protein